VTCLLALPPDLFERLTMPLATFARFLSQLPQSFRLVSARWGYAAVGVGAAFLLGVRTPGVRLPARALGFESLWLCLDIVFRHDVSSMSRNGVSADDGPASARHRDVAT